MIYILQEECKWEKKKKKNGTANQPLKVSSHEKLERNREKGR